jgi:pimeloyl-ACP methyl ester carboxylesterase
LHRILVALTLLLPSALSALEPCKLADGSEARCGTFEVWENREAKAGRKLALRVLVLPATGAARKPDPVFFVAGGPGESAVDYAGYFGRRDASLRRERDLVFVDARGVAGSGRLACTLGGRDDDLQTYLGDKFPLAAVRECRKDLEKIADLTQYTSAAIVDDLDDARAWLGYDKVNLDGGSYGTRLVQVWLRRHPGSVRTATMTGVIPMDESNPVSHAAGSQRALDLVLSWCEADAACRKAFPNVRAELGQVLDRLAASPAETEVKHPGTGQPVKVRLSREVLADGLQVFLYDARASARLPLLIHEAAQGRLGPLADAAVRSRYNITKGIAIGVLLSVTCAEDIPYIDPTTVAERTAGTFLGDFRVRQQMAACGEWPRARVEPGHREPVRADVPVLLLSGERDPVTPPAFAERARQRLANGLHVVIPFGSHLNPWTCIDEVRWQLVDKGAVQGIDTSCMQRIERPPFALE